MKTIIVTGCAGFIGWKVAGQLLANDNTVIGLDNMNDYYDPGLKEWRLQFLKKENNFTFFKADISDFAAVRKIFSADKIDAVINLAARAGVRASVLNPWVYLDTNVKGTLNLLEAARLTGVKNFVFASSSSVYGINSKVPFSEEDPITCPISPYATTKRAGELMCFTYSHLYNIPVTCLRFFTVYGEKGRPDMAIAKFTRLIADGKEIQVYGDGSARRDFTYIGDIVAGLLHSIYKPSRYEIINLGGSNTVELSSVISLIEANLGKKARIKYTDPMPGDVPITYADVTKARKLLGFEPKVAIDEGVRRYVAWFLEREKNKAVR